LDIRLRRFLITEPMTPLSRLGLYRLGYLRLLAIPTAIGLPLLDAATLPKLGPSALTGVEVRRLKQVVDSLGVDPERAAHPDSGQLSVVH
jgi:hypothetical protein